MITIAQWRAVIGSFNPTRKKSRSTKGIVISGRPIRTALRLILFLSISIILGGDVETNPGPEQNKRPLENTGVSPNNTTQAKRVDQRISPEVVSQGSKPQAVSSLVSAANESHPLYTPGRPVVYLSLDNGVLTNTEKTPTRRCLSLDDQNSSTSQTTTHDEIPDNPPKWFDKLILKIDDIRDRVCEIENVIQTIKDTQDKVETLERNIHSMKSQVDKELKVSNEEVVKL